MIIPAQLSGRPGKRLPGLDAAQTAHLRASLASRARCIRLRSGNPSSASDLSADADPWTAPVEADASIAYGFHHALGCLRQDRPALFWAGIAGWLYLAIGAISALLATLPGWGR